MKWVIKIDESSWIAPWAGDPGRTLKIENAAVFPNKRSAETALSVFKKSFPNRNWEKAELQKIN